MALAVEGGNVQAMQQFIGVGGWDDEAVLARHQQLVAETLGDAQRGRADPRWLRLSQAGAATRWAWRGSSAGRWASGPTARPVVLAAYASPAGYTLVDRRLYLPERLVQRRLRRPPPACGVPADLAFQTKPALAWELVATAARSGAACPFAG